MRSADRHCQTPGRGSLAAHVGREADAPRPHSLGDRLILVDAHRHNQRFLSSPYRAAPDSRACRHSLHLSMWHLWYANGAANGKAMYGGVNPKLSFAQKGTFQLWVNTRHFNLV